MFDQPPLNRDQATQSLGQALRQLAAQPAPTDDWPRLQASLAKRRRAVQRSAWRDYALAAGLLIGVALALSLGPAAPPSENLQAQAPSLEQLQTESANLESWIRQQAGQNQLISLDAERISARQELFDRLRWVDGLLAQPVAADSEHALWQQRVLLLRRLALESASPAADPALARQAPVILL